MGLWNRIKKGASKAYRSVGGVKGVIKKMGEAAKHGRTVGGYLKRGGDVATSLGYGGVGDTLKKWGGTAESYSGKVKRAHQLATDTQKDVASAKRHARMGSFGGVGDIAKGMWGRLRGAPRYVRGGGD